MKDDLFQVRWDDEVSPAVQLRKAPLPTTRDIQDVPEEPNYGPLNIASPQPQEPSQQQQRPPVQSIPQQVPTDNSEPVTQQPVESPPLEDTSDFNVQWDEEPKEEQAATSDFVVNWDDDGEQPPSQEAPVDDLAVTWDDTHQEPTMWDRFKETVIRPVARAGKNIATGVLGGAGDLAQSAANVVASGLLPDPRSEYGGEFAQNVLDSFSATPASESLRQTVDQATGGLTAPRNAAERVSDTAAEFTAGAIGPTALSKVTNIYSQIAKSFGATTMAEVGGAAGLGAGIQTANEVAASKGLESATLGDQIVSGVIGLAAGAAAGKAGSSTVSRASDELGRLLSGKSNIEAIKNIETKLGTTSIEDTVEATRMTPTELSDAVNLMDGDSIASRIINQPESPAGVENVSRIFGKSSAYTQLVNKYGKLYDLERAKSALGTADVGSLDILESSEITKVTNRAASNRVQPLSMIGGDGQDFVLVRDSEGRLVADRTVKPLRKIYDDAARDGGTEKELKDFIAAKDAIDDYTAKAFHIQKLDDQIAELSSQTKSIETKEELIGLKQLKKKLEGYQARMPQHTAEAIVHQYNELPWSQRALQENNKLNNLILEMHRKAGTLSVADIERIRTAHPNYVPAYKVVEDLTTGVEQTVGRKPGASRGIRARGDSAGLKTMDVMEAQIRNIVSSSSAAEKSTINNSMLQYLMKLPEDELSFIFQESKSDIIKSIEELTKPGSTTKKITSSDILGRVTGTEGGETVLQRSGNVKFFIDGKELQLTLKDPDLVQLFNSIPTAEETWVGFKLAKSYANFMRNAITVYDPTFFVRSLQRESGDMPGYIKRGGFIAPLLRGEKPQYYPFFSQVKALFAKEFDRDTYDMLEANYGRSSYNRLDGKSTDEIVEYISGKDKQGAVGRGLSKTVNTMENLSRRFDMAPRYVNYQLMMKNGANHHEAMRVAFEMGFNPTQSGLSPGFRKFTSYIPFSTAFINSTDRLIRLAKYDPSKIATGFILGTYVPYKMIDLQNNLWTNPETGRPWKEDSDPNLDRYLIKIYGPWSKSANDYVPFSLGWVLGRAAKPFDQTMSYVYNKIEEGLEVVANDTLNRDDPTAKELRDMGVTEKDVIHGWLNYSTDLATVPTSIPGVSAAMGLIMNKDRFGREIVSEFTQQERPELSYLEYDSTTSPSIVAFAKGMKELGFNISPKQAQYLYENTTFGIGQVGLTLADTLYRAVNKEGPESVRNPNFPGSKLLKGNMDIDRPVTGRSTYFKGIKDEVMTTFEASEVLKQKAEQGQVPTEDYVKYVEKNKDVLKWYGTVKGAQEQLNDIYRFIDQIKTTDASQTPERELLGDPLKQENINQLLKQVDLIQKTILDTISKDKDSRELYYKRYKDISLPEKVIQSEAVGKAGDQLQKMLNIGSISTSKEQKLKKNREDK